MKLKNADLGSGCDRDGVALTTMELSEISLTPSQIQCLGDSAEALAHVASVALALGLLLEHTDPVVRKAARTIEELALRPWLDHVKTIHELKPNRIEHHSLNLVSGQYVSVGDRPHNTLTLPFLEGPYKHFEISDDERPGTFKLKFSCPSDFRQRVLKINGKEHKAEYAPYAPSVSVEVKPGDVIECGPDFLCVITLFAEKEGDSE